jgi:hypothetical protein
MHSTAPAVSQARPRHAGSDPPAARRLVLVPAEGRGDELVRRYRLARLRVEPRRATGPDRFAHLARRHD